MGTNVRKILKAGENKKLRNVENKKRVPPYAFLILYISTFLIICWYFLYVRNADVLFFMQDRGWWNDTRLFFEQCIRVPGGLLSWAGAYLTQYFYYPALGCSMLILVWLLTFALAKWSFRVPSHWSFLLFLPMAALLASDIQLGYWIYILRDIDYIFYHPLGLLAATLLSLPFWQFLPFGDKAKRRIALAWIPLVATLFYYPFGIYALLAAVLTALQAFTSVQERGEKVIPYSLSLLVLLLLSLGLVPLLETSGSTLLRSDQPWTYGFHRFELDDLRDYSLELPFLLALLLPLGFPFIRRIKSESLLLSQGTMAAATALMLLGLFSRDFNDYNFHAELRMQRAVEECRWADVLQESTKAKGPVTREMIMFRDIALMNRHELLSKRYIYNNESIQPVTVSDSIHIRIANQAGDLIYLNYGETIFAIRRAMERAMHYGFSHYTLRVLAKCAIVNGEKDNARKYLRLLSHSTFQKKWSKEMRPFAEDDKLLPQSDHFRLPLKLYNEGSELVGTDDSYVELTILKKWMYTLTHEPEAQQVALAAAMIMRDRQCFWSQVQQFYNINPSGLFPTHVQEAMLFEVYELGMKGVNLSFVKFDDRVVQRYNAFKARLEQYSSQGMNEQQIGSMLRPEFGDTYMWDYCVLRQVQTN